MNNRDLKLQALYQNLCDAQDNAEYAGELSIMNEIKNLRYKVDRIRFAD